MAKQEYEFTLILSGVRELTREVLDAFYEAGCDDALIGMRDGTAYADFCREADSFNEAVFSAIRDVEKAGAGAGSNTSNRTSSSPCRRSHGAWASHARGCKRVAGMRGPGNFPPPVGRLTQRSPVWHWTDVVRWHEEYQQKETTAAPRAHPKDAGQEHSGRTGGRTSRR